MIFGLILTFMVQSSSITTSLIVPLAGSGVLTLIQIFPYTLGANIGTTATAIIAALTLNATALVAAFAHLLFNILGIMLIYPIPQIRKIPIFLAERLSEYSIKNRFVPIYYLLTIFIIIPLTIISHPCSFLIFAIRALTCSSSPLSISGSAVVSK